MTKVISVANQKGGVRKTTTTATLGYVLSQEYHKKVLLIDADPQKSLTKKFVDSSNIPTKATLYITLKENEDLQISSTRFSDLDIVPSNISLAAIETEIVGEFDSRTRLREGIDKLDNYYDYILIDCPPSLGVLSTNGLAAANKIIIPLSHLGDETDGMSDLITTINKVRKHLNPSLSILGLLQTMVDSTKLCESFRIELEKKYSTLLFQSQIPRSILQSEATDKNQLIFEYKAPDIRKLPIENAYRKLVTEIISKF